MVGFRYIDEKVLENMKEAVQPDAEDSDDEEEEEEEEEPMDIDAPLPEREAEFVVDPDVNLASHALRDLLSTEAVGSGRPTPAKTPQVAEIDEPDYNW